MNVYEVLSKQAQVILNVADLSNAGRLDVQLAEQAEYDKQIENYLDQKRVLYEQFILKQITIEPTVWMETLMTAMAVGT